jgi:16S rRNA processing protein RimM
MELFTNRSERAEPGAQLHHGTTLLEVTTSRPVPGGRAGRPARFVVGFAGVRSREQAEDLRDAVLYAPPLADEDALWVHELIGALLVDRTGTEVGRVTAVEANPASDLLVLADGALVPLHFVVERSPGRLTVDLPPGLLELHRA